MKENKLKSRKRWAWLAVAALLLAGLGWTADPLSDGEAKEARRIIVYTTTS
ncbi:hypothetical protein ACF3MZ_23815 [Paenibacillaceae bacterium WGS1546]|uniref:hypothetical protein n=1 Tax=Cohnella sp. WGS1546 TaxID=3366810 RepID=UPI00372D3B37